MAGDDHARCRRVRRRGIASVLAMMFLVIFGSLAAAMAVVAQGNLRTADSSLKVSRAMSAAETGIVFATSRMQQEASRFVVEQGVIDADFAAQLWLGTINPADVIVLPPVYDPPVEDPSGVMEAIRDAHLADLHDIIVEPGDSALPTIDDVLGILIVRPIAIGPESGAPYFRLRYELLDQFPMVRVTSEGVDGEITRHLQMDFRLDKKIEFAILSTNRIMIGKNVLVQGPLGSRYGVDPVTGNPNPLELETENGDPLVMRSDFYFLEDGLDLKLDLLFAQVVADDVDGDGRLRPDHPVEGANLGGDLIDYDGDEYVDDFDLFLAHFDANADFMVCYDSVLAAEAGLGALADEFDDVDGVIDFQMCRLIDDTMPDRDGDGDAATPTDIGLGYHDGVLDINDLYAKVTGQIAFAVARADWEAAQGDESYQTVVHGPVRAPIDEAPAMFEVGDEDLLEITTGMFDVSHSWFEAQVPAEAARNPGDPPLDPVLLIDVALEAGIFTAAADAEFEAVPFGSRGAYDHYLRPIFDGFTFKNVRIPMGTNALFVNCTFVGVTFIESETRCSHKDWNYAGALQPVGDPVMGVFELRFPDLPPPPPDHIDIDGWEVLDTRDYSNNLRFDSCTFLGSIAGDKLDEYTHWRNKVQITGATRYYLDSSEVIPDTLTDAAGVLLTTYLDGLTAEERTELAKSSLLLPGWSVDVGNFTNEVEGDPADTPVVNLRGVIIAGVLDVRGTAHVRGTLLMTFRPEAGAGPLFYGGQPDAFNTTIGYFGPADGDDEGVNDGEGEFAGYGEIRLEYDRDAVLPDGIPWPVSLTPEPGTYVEGGS